MRKVFAAILLVFSMSALGQQFVTPYGKELVLAGTQYRINGANQYYLSYKPQKMVDEIFAAALKLRINVIRTWGFCDGQWKDGHSFQPSPRVYNEETFKKLDYVLWRAQHFGIKVIIPFINNWDEFGGMNQYISWSPTAEKTHDAFYKDPWTKQLYKDYVAHLLNRVNTYTNVAYKNDPTILMWELTNEMRAQSDPSGELIQNWTQEMASFVKSIDRNHMLSTGMEGFGRGGNDWLTNGSNGTNFIQNHAIPEIDIVSYHLYVEHWGINESYADWWIRDSVRIASALNKPVYCGEFGLKDKANRRRVYAQWYGLHPNMVLWLLAGHQEDGSLYPDYDGLSIYPDDEEIGQVIRDH